MTQPLDTKGQLSPGTQEMLNHLQAAVAQFLQTMRTTKP